LGVNKRPDEETGDTPSLFALHFIWSKEWRSIRWTWVTYDKHCGACVRSERSAHARTTQELGNL